MAQSHNVTFQGTEGRLSNREEFAIAHEQVVTGAAPRTIKTSCNYSTERLEEFRLIVRENQVTANRWDLDVSTGEPRS